MTLRTTETTVIFDHPWSIRGFEGELPAGSYTVETEEEMLTGVSFPAYRRVRTTIIVPGRSGNGRTRQLAEIEPADLAEALRRDAALMEPRAGAP
jgi:hypothetical protein